MYRSCSQHRNDLTNFVEALRLAKMLEGQPTPRIVDCVSCNSGDGANCTGPQLVEIRSNDPLVFEPISVKRQPLQIELTQLTVRQAGASAIEQHHVNVKVWKIDKDQGRRIVYRAHVDHRVPTTLEPLSHLHLGGCHYSSDAEEEDWDIPKAAGLLRWPMPSADILLAAEILVASCDVELWKCLLDETPFREAIRRAEDEHMGAHFIEQWLAYVANRERPTFLDHFYSI